MCAGRRAGCFVAAFSLQTREAALEAAANPTPHKLTCAAGWLLRSSQSALGCKVAEESGESSSTDGQSSSSSSAAAQQAGQLDN